MKKTISINISGILFHIEEDGYDTLRKYLEAINKHFSSYKDNHEIISDIENRIAEIFLSNLKNNKQVITADNVEKLIEKMGTIEDFSIGDEDVIEEKVETDDKAKGEDYYKYVTPPNEDKRGYKKLVRLENKKILGGVCAGFAKYFSIDPLWTRLIAILLLFSGNLNFNFDLFNVIPFDNFRFNLGLGLLAVIAYIVLWIILPVSYEMDEDKNIKKLYRNPDDRVLGGVSSGMAAYFGIDVLYIRLAFVLLIILGGSGVLIYLILWIITPVAASITQRIKMKGGEITLDNIDTTIKENMNPEQPQEKSRVREVLLTPFRVIGQIIDAIGEALGPLGLFILNIFRVIFGLIVFMIGLGITIAPLLTMAVYFGILQSPDYQALIDDFPIELFSNLVPVWLIFGASFLMIIPGIIIILLGISVLSKKNIINGRFALVALGLWLLCIGICAFQIPRIAAQFRSENTYSTQESIPASGGTLILKMNEIGDEATFNEVGLKIVGTADSTLTLKREAYSKGRNRAEAMENAKLLTYEYTVLDSVITFDEGFDIDALDMFRDQKLNLILEVPYGQAFIMERSILDIIRNTIYRNGYRTSDVSYRNVWEFNEDGLQCLTCEKKEEVEEDTEAEASATVNITNDEGTSMTIEIDSTGVKVDGDLIIEADNSKNN